jgi:enoyl-CoA hydratase
MMGVCQPAANRWNDPMTITAPPSTLQRTSYADGKILLDIGEGIATIRFNHPDKHNAMSVEMWEGLGVALKVARDDDSVRVLMLTGEGGKAFISGGDISQFDHTMATPEQRKATAERAGAWRKLLANFGKPTISSVRGYCIGGGLGLALTTDIRIAAEGSQFGIPAAKLSIAYPFDGLRLLVNVVGPSWARLLMYTAMRIDAEEALRIGLINRLVPADRLEAESLAIARQIADNAPLSVAASKMTVDLILKDPERRDMAPLAALAERCANSEDSAEGRRAFMEKRAPRFKGR